MPRLDDVSPERLDALVDGASPEGSDERELVSMMSELRGLEADAPDSLVEKVGALGDEPAAEPESGGSAPALWSKLSAPFRARPKLAWGLAPAALVIALAVIVVPAVNDGGNGDSFATDASADIAAPEAAPEAFVDSASAGDGADQAASAPLEERDRAAQDEAEKFSSSPEQELADSVAPDAPTTPSPGSNFRSIPPSAGAAAGGVAPDALPPSTDPDRPQELFGQTTLGVADAKGLSDATSGAMKLVRDLGGFTESSQFGTSSDDRGRAEMVLRVPTDKTETALTGFAKLGTVIDQQVSINDLGEELAAVEDDVTRLNKRVSELKAQLAKSPADSRIQSQLASAEVALERAKRVKTSTTEQVKERTQFSTLNLSIVVTSEIGPADENRFGAAIERSWDRLAGVLAGVLEVLITASPLVILGALGIWGARAARRRSNGGLLAKP